MQPITVALISVTAASAALGLLVYRRAPNRAANRLWAVFSLLEGCWGLTIYFLVTSGDPETAILYLRGAHFISIFVLVALIDFCWAFPQRVSKPRPAGSRLSLYLSGLIIAGIASMPALVKSIHMRPAAPDVEFGWPLLPVTVYVFALFLYADVTLWRKATRLRGIARLQTLYLLIGTAIAQVLVFTTNLVLPIATGHTAYSAWGPISYFFIIVASAIAMAKHNLWDMGTAARRVAAGLITILTVTGIATILAWMLLQFGIVRDVTVSSHLFLWLTLGLIFGMAVIPTYSWFRGVFSKALKRDHARVSSFLNELEKAIVNPPGEALGLNQTIEAIQQFARTTFVAAYVRNDHGQYHNVAVLDKHSYLPSNWNGIDDDDRLPPTVARRLKIESHDEPLNAAHLLRFANTEQEMAQLEAIEQLDASVLMPLLWQDETIGIIVIGPKISGDVYSPRELQLLQRAGAHGAVAVRNNELMTQVVAEKERTAKIISQMGSGVIAVDADKRISVVNPAAETMLGVEKEELIDEPAAVLPGPLRQPLIHAFDDGQIQDSTTDYLPGQPPIHIAISPFVLHGQGQQPEGAGLVFRDLSTEDALRRAEHEAEQLRFVRTIAAGLAHEIRNPLVSVRTFAQLAPTRLDDPEFRNSFMEVAESEIGQLEQLVSQFMTLARPTGKVTEDVELDEVVKKAVQANKQRAAKKNINVKLNLSENLPIVEGDASRLKSAAVNLFINAIDATHEGGKIHVTLSHTPSDDDNDGKLILEVWNSGSYIPPGDREQLFEPFYTTKATGTGLGLVICQSIAHEHDGEIIVESDKDAGTSFKIAIPVTTTTQKQKVTQQ